jgi:hypothetical protein
VLKEASLEGINMTVGNEAARLALIFTEIHRDYCGNGIQRKKQSDEQESHRKSKLEGGN